MEEFFRCVEEKLAAMTAEGRADVISDLQGILRGLYNFKVKLPGIPWKATMKLIKDMTFLMGLGKKGPEVLARAKKVAAKVGPHIVEVLHAI